MASMGGMPTRLLELNSAIDALIRHGVELPTELRYGMSSAFP
jgi:hypothetical protein